jgi:hypothetical protein
MSICLIGQHGLLLPLEGLLYFLLLPSDLSVCEKILGNLEVAESLCKLVQSDIYEKEVLR